MCMWAWFWGRRLRKWWVSINFWSFWKFRVSNLQKNVFWTRLKNTKTNSTTSSSPISSRRKTLFSVESAFYFNHTVQCYVENTWIYFKIIVIHFECLVCPEGFYGDCSMPCTCENGATCEPVNGTCVCTAGYMGVNCEQECLEWKHGMHCEWDCSCVRSNTQSCDHTNGECLCKSGYKVMESQFSKLFAVEIYYLRSISVLYIAEENTSFKLRKECGASSYENQVFWVELERRGR